jgi:predicted ribosomally synthesized peptide with SipW-like signal peptide
MSNGKHRNKEFRPAGSANMARMGGVLLASLLVGSLVITASRAAFTDTTDNTGNSFTAGDVDLVDDDSGSVMFNVSNMVPADSVTDCIVVTYQGSVVDPSAVKLYSGGYTDSGDFADYLNLTVEEGSGGSFGDCTLFSLENTIESGGTVTAFDTTHTDYASGAGVWDPSGTPQSKTYRITVELDAATPNAEQGESVTALTFTWEVQN